MKKLLLLIALVASVASFAQGDSNAKGKGKGKGKNSGVAKKELTPEERAEKITARMKTELSLTDDQTPKVKSITLTRVQKMKEIRAKYKESQDKEALKTERKAVHQTWETDLKAILTADQFAKYQAKKEERKKKLEERRKNANKKAEGAPQQGEETLEELEEEVGE